MDITSFREKVRKYANGKFTYEEINDQFIKLSSSESIELRKKYILQFVRNNSYFLKYKNDSEPSTQLWNAFNSELITMNINDLIKDFPLSNNLFMFWDYPIINHPMFKLGRDCIFKISSEELLNSYLRFPSNTYFFDEFFDKTLFITHEDFNYDKQEFLLVKYGSPTLS